MKRNWKRVVSLILVLAMMVLSVTDIFGTGKVYAAENNRVTVHFKCEWGGANIFY